MHETNLNEIILCAAQDRELEGYGDLTDMHLHTILRQLYRDFAAGAVTKDTAASIKEKAVSAWKSDKETEEQYRTAVKNWNAAIVASNDGRTAMRKAETLRDFAVSAAQVVEKMTGEKGFVAKAMAEQWG